MNSSSVMSIDANKIVVRNEARFNETCQVLFLLLEGLVPLPRFHFGINVKTVNLTVIRTPWVGDQPVSTQENTSREDADIHPYLDYYSNP
jgi:hypothetical protein